MTSIGKTNNSPLAISGVFLTIGVLLIIFSILLELQIAAFVGLGLTFWGAVLALTRNGKYVESSLLDGTARSMYSTIDRMINDLKFNGHGYYIPPYPQDGNLPEYLKGLKDPVVYISEKFDGKISVDELASGKLVLSKMNGLLISCPGTGIMTQVEKYLKIDLSKISLPELQEMLPKCLSESLNLVRNAQLSYIPNGANFKAVGIIYDSFYDETTRPKSVGLLGCPVVSAVACSLAKSSGKTVSIKELTAFPGNSINVLFSFM